MECEFSEKEIQDMELEMLMDMDRVCRKNHMKYSLAFGTVLGAVRHKGFIPWDLDADIMVDIDSYRHFCDVLQNGLPDKYLVYSYWNLPQYEYLLARVGLKDQGHRDIHVDIFPMVGTPKTDAGRKLYARTAYLLFRFYFLKKIKAGENYRDEPRKRRIARILRVILFPFPAGLFLRISERLQRAFPVVGSEYLYNFCGLYKYKEIIPSAYYLDLTDLEFEGYRLPVPVNWDGYLTQMYGDYMTPRKTNYV